MTNENLEIWHWVFCCLVFTTFVEMILYSFFAIHQYWRTSLRSAAQRAPEDKREKIKKGTAFGGFWAGRKLAV